MKRRILSLFLALPLWLAAHEARAAIIDFLLGADDYALLKIDGTQVALVDSYPGASDYFTLDLAPGFHALDLLFMNRWGTAGVGLYWKDPSETNYVPIPESSLFSLDQNGVPINGLRGDYTSQQFAPFTIYGEGPIVHHRDAYGDGGRYENIIPRHWADRLTGWEVFQESMTGSLFIASSNSVPEPGSFLMFAGVAAIGLLVGVRRSRRVNA